MLPAKMPEESRQLRAITTNSCLASGGKARKDSSRLYSKNEGNRLAKVRYAFLTRLPLAVSAGHFGAIGDMPWAVSLHNRRELVCMRLF
jgi:hypothetical protein